MRLYLKRSHPRQAGIAGWLKNGFGELMWHFGKSLYCHVELEFSERHDRLSYSSVPTEGPRLTRLEYHPAEWDGYEMAIAAEREDAIWQAVQKRLGPAHNYDAKGLGAFLMPRLIKPSQSDLWCSEAVVEAGRAGGLFIDLIPEKATPDDCCESAMAAGWRRV